MEESVRIMNTDLFMNGLFLKHDGPDIRNSGNYCHLLLSHFHEPVLKCYGSEIYTVMYEP